MKAAQSMLLAAALLTAFAASARDWRLLGSVSRSASDAREVTGMAELDASSLTLADGLVRAWVRETFSGEVHDGAGSTGVGYTVSKTLYGFRCQDRNVAVLAYTSYRADGTMAESRRERDASVRFAPAPSNSVLEQAAGVACQLADAKRAASQGGR